MKKPHTLLFLFFISFHLAGTYFGVANAQQSIDPKLLLNNPTIQIPGDGGCCRTGCSDCNGPPISFNRNLIPSGSETDPIQNARDLRWHFDTPQMQVDNRYSALSSMENRGNTNCPKIKDMIPPKLISNRINVGYHYAPEYQKCRKEVLKQFRKLRNTGDKFRFRLRQIARKKPEKRTYKTILENFISQCVMTKRKEDIIPDKLLANLKSKIGMFYFTDKKTPICTGTQVGKYIITARHCFTSTRGGPIYIVPDMRFSFFNSPEDEMQIELASEFHKGKQANFFTPKKPENDWVILKIKNPPEATTFKIKANAPVDWDDTITISHNSWQNLLNEVNQYLPETQELDDQKNLKKLRSEPVYDASKNCYVNRIEGNIFIHSCLTDVYNSGAPILKKDTNGNFSLIGIHAGYYENSSYIKTCFPISWRSEAPNYAIVLPKQIQNKLNIQGK